MDIREIHQATIDYLTMVRGFLTGPFAQREPATAKAWLADMMPMLASLGRFECRRQEAKNCEETFAEPDPAEKDRISFREKMLLREFDMLLSWAIPAVLWSGVGPKDAAAAREALQPHIDIVLQETRRRGMGAFIEGWIPYWEGSPPRTSKAKDEPD